MTPEQIAELNKIQDDVTNVIRHLMSIDPARLETLLKEYTRMHAMMPITDPTGYRRLMQNLGAFESAVRIVAACRAGLQRIYDVESRPN